MVKKYTNLFELIQFNPTAKAYFQGLPEPVQEQISSRSNRINSFQAREYSIDLNHWNHTYTSRNI